MDRREAIEWLEQIKDIYIRGGDEDFDRRRKEALDLAIESLQEKHQLSGKTSTISEKESVEGDAEAATTTDCNYTCSDCKHQDKAYEQEPCHSCFNNDGAGYEPDTDCISRQEDMGEVSDGYHTFNQLYHQRAVLFATIVNQNKDKAWKSWKHEDGKFCFDKNGEWFIVGIDTPEGSYTYHYEQKYWDMFDCEELDGGKHWDGHTEEDVTRLLSLPPVNQKQATSKLESAENATSEDEESTMGQPKSKLYIPLNQYTVERINRLHKNACGDYFDEEWLYNELEQIAEILPVTHDKRTETHGVCSRKEVTQHWRNIHTGEVGK